MSDEAVKKRIHRKAVAVRRHNTIAASIPPDMLRLSAAMLIRDVMVAFNVTRATARTAVLLAGSSRNPRNSQYTNEGETK